MHALGGLGQIGFRQRSQHFAHRGQRVQHQLPGRDRHRTEGIKLRRDLIDAFSLAQSMLDSQILVLCPAWRFGGWRRRFLLVGLPGFGGAHQFADHFPQRFRSRHFALSAIGGQHGPENIDRGEGHFGERSVRRGPLR